MHLFFSAYHSIICSKISLTSAQAKWAAEVRRAPDWKKSIRGRLPSSALLLAASTRTAAAIPLRVQALVVITYPGITADGVFLGCPSPTSTSEAVN